MPLERLCGQEANGEGGLESTHRMRGGDQAVGGGVAYRRAKVRHGRRTATVRGWQGHRPAVMMPILRTGSALSNSFVTN